MTNPLAETFPLPYGKYADLAARYCQEQKAMSDREMPRAEDLRKQIEALTDAARKENLMLDDESILISEQSAEIRRSLDEIMPEFQSLAQATARRLAMTRHFKGRIEAAMTEAEDFIRVPLGEIMVLLNLAEPEFTNNT